MFSFPMRIDLNIIGDTSYPQMNIYIMQFAIYYDVLKSHGLGQLSLTRPAHECNTHDNVLFVGASSRPGNGVPVSVSQSIHNSC
jgi:hypothetical protein